MTRSCNLFFQSGQIVTVLLQDSGENCQWNKENRLGLVFYSVTATEMGSEGHQYDNFVVPTFQN